jgi:putative oxidoreductase
LDLIRKAAKCDSLERNIRTELAFKFNLIGSFLESGRLLLSALLIFAERLLLIALFLPFSALDKIFNFEAAVEQAAKVFASRALAVFLILSGFAIEILMSLAILTGILDRIAALVLALYCAVTALLWKQFWKKPDFRLKGASQGRDLFWDFMKNFALAGGFLVLAFGPNLNSVGDFISHPLSSSHPYSLDR